MAKILGMEQFFSTVKKELDFTGEWLQAFGRPENKGAWIIWGTSGSGKTRFAVQLCKYLSKFGRVAYDSLEEGDSLSLKRAFEAVNMLEESGRVVLLNRMSITELSGKLSKRKSWDIVIIDSFQYSGLKYNDYLKLRQEHPNKLFIFISHAVGKEPKGSSAQSIRYDCDCKVYVEGFRATVTSRFKEGMDEYYIIWKEAAARYWGEIDNQNMEG